MIDLQMMKLPRRIVICTGIVFLIIFMAVTSQETFSISKLWYHITAASDKSETLSLDMATGSQAYEKIDSETKRLENDFKDFHIPKNPIKKVEPLYIRKELDLNSKNLQNDMKEWNRKKDLIKNPRKNKQKAIQDNFNNGNIPVVSVNDHKSLNRLIQPEQIDKKAIQTREDIEKLKEKKSKFKSKVILIYTGLHKEDEWYNLPRTKLKNYLNTTGCKQTNCIVTYEKGFMALADAVIFHERNIPSDSFLRALSKFRPISQRWIFFTSETPKNSDYGAIPYNGLFNWTMTYKTESDIYLPYLQYRKLKKNQKIPDPNKNYAAGRKKTVAWLVGNCDFELRMEFAHVLEHYIPIDVGGNCRDDFKNQINCTRWCDLDILKDYKFYLAFENGVCTDYISEKYWRYLEMDLIPIVLGGANYSDPRLAIPGSFIDATKFKSIKHLADYIQYLDQNDTAYNEYFKWKQKYKIWHPQTGDWPFESYFLCKICKMLNQDLPRKIYYKLSDFWDEYTDCEVPERILKDRLVLSGYSYEERQRQADLKHRGDMANIPVDFDEE